MLSAYNAFVDTVQSAKTQFVKKFAPNEEIAKPLQTYIDAQTSLAKHLGQEMTNFWTTVGMAAWAFDAKKAFPNK